MTFDYTSLSRRYGSIVIHRIVMSPQVVNNLAWLNLIVLIGCWVVEGMAKRFIIALRAITKNYRPKIFRHSRSPNAVGVNTKCSLPYLCYEHIICVSHVLKLWGRNIWAVAYDASSLTIKPLACQTETLIMIQIPVINKKVTTQFIL